MFQLIVAEEMQVLRTLKTDYGIQCLITEAVEAELRRIVERKVPGKLSVLKKALGSDIVVVLDEPILARTGYKAGSALIDQIEQLALSYATRVDRGEAYTHAASNVLGVPSLSQDLAALRRLISSGIHVERPILRAFDIFVFGLQIGVLEPTDCKRIRRELLKSGETILDCFSNCSVMDGLPNFFQRISDPSKPQLGSTNPLAWLDDRIWVRSV